MASMEIKPNPSLNIRLNIKIIKMFPEVATGPVVTHKNYEDKEKIKQILLSIKYFLNFVLLLPNKISSL